MRRVHNALRRSVQDSDVMPDFPGKRVSSATFGVCMCVCLCLFVNVRDCTSACPTGLPLCSSTLWSMPFFAQWLRRFVSKVVDDDRHRSLNAYFRLVCCMYREELLECGAFREFVGVTDA